MSCRRIDVPVDDQIAARGYFAERSRDGAHGLHGCVTPALAAVVGRIDEGAEPIGDGNR
jgi:hypothetical protein